MNKTFIYDGEGRIEEDREPPDWDGDGVVIPFELCPLCHGLLIDGNCRRCTKL